MAEEDRIAQLEQRLARLEGASGRDNFALSQYNPLVTRGAGRIILQIPFDDSLDSTNALECFFQMPTQTRAIRAAKVWVQQKPYRTYSSSASTVSGGSINSGVPSATDTAIRFTGTNQSTHDHGGTVAVEATTYYDDITTEAVTLADDAHTHNVSITGHTHALDSTISETASSGTLSLFVADDGTNYGSAIISGASSIVAQTILAQLTRTSGDKRIKIVTTGKTRIQVLLLLDLRVAVIG